MSVSVNNQVDSFNGVSQIDRCYMTVKEFNVAHVRQCDYHVNFFGFPKRFDCLFRRFDFVVDGNITRTVQQAGLID